MMLTIMVAALVSILPAVSAALLDKGNFLSEEPPTAMANVLVSRSLLDCAANCLPVRCLPEHLRCTGLCWSVTSSECYLNMTSELPPEVLECFQRVTPSCPLACGYLLIRGQCVKMYNVSKPQPEAKSRCEQDGGHQYYYIDLPRDKPVIVDLLNITGTDPKTLGVGAERMTSSLEFRWLSGSFLSDSDSAWASGEPNDDAEDCVELYTLLDSPGKTRRLNDIHCLITDPFICQIDM